MGRDKAESYVDAQGILRHKSTFVISRFLTGTNVGSATTASRDTLSGTTS